MVQEWIADGHRRCRRHLDTFIGMEAGILATHARLTLAVGEPGRADAIARELLSVAARASTDDLVGEATAILAAAGSG